MSSQPPQQSKEAIVPLSVVFITLGFIVLLTVGVIWAATARYIEMPELIERAIAPFQESVAAPVVEPATAAVLLPETPLVSLTLPSFASVEMAPRINYEALPGQPSRMVIPKIDLDAPIQQVALEEVELDGQSFYQWAVPLGPIIGWHSDSAPLGQPGNSVFNGHHNIYGQVFRDLIDLVVGDEIIVYDDEQRFVYQVSEHELMPERGEPFSVRLANAAWIEETADERITLVTCWPFTDNSHRLIIVALPVQ